MINAVTLVGRLTKDPELANTSSGASLCRFTLAVQRKFSSQDKQEADFINCISWNKTAENLAAYQHKGSLVGVEGRIHTGSYTNDRGEKIYTTEVVAERVTFLEPKEKGNERF